MIVERPERILACALGVSAAYIRLGSRHKGGHHAPHPEKAPSSERPFQIRKSSRSMDITSPAVVAVHGNKWMEELQVMCDQAGTKLSLGLKELARPSDVVGAEGAGGKPAFHEGDLYLCSETLNALQGAAGGVCDAVDAIFSRKLDAPQRAFVAVRPPGHHCSSDWPSGFCWINNVHIGIEYAAQNYGLTHAVILDFDLHHGDGSQEITWDKNTKSAAMPKNVPFSKKTTIGYYSMHDINSYPCEWGDKEKVQNASLCIDNAHGQSIWNVHLESWSTMDEFWALYETKYSVLLEKARAFLKKHTERIKITPKLGAPKAAIFISAGFDASEWEGAGMQRHAVNVPTEFYARFSQDVVKLAQEEGTAVDGHVISVLEGGYSDRALTSGVVSHLSGLGQNASPFPTNEAEEMVSAIQRMNLAAMGMEPSPSDHEKPTRVPEYDVEWWHAANLTALENYITPPPPPPPAPKRASRTLVPTYATPTESFTHKVVDPTNFARSVSSTLRPVQITQHYKPVNVLPPPEVDWIVATTELSKLLIPTDRQTRSCRPEELAAPRAKKDRFSEPPALPVDTGRQLRGRKAKSPDLSPPPTADAADMDALTENMRRQTISDLPSRSGAVEDAQPLQARRNSRRASQIFKPTTNGEKKDLAASNSSEPATASSRPTTAIPPPTVKGRRTVRTTARPTPSSAASTKDVQPVRVELRRSPTAMAIQEPRSSTIPPRASTSLDVRPAAGPRKITLKLGSREESQRKQLERLEAEKAQKKADRAKLSAARPKPTAAASKAKNEKIEVPAPIPALEESLPTPPEPAHLHEVRRNSSGSPVPQVSHMPMPAPKHSPLSQGELQIDTTSRLQPRASDASDSTRPGATTASSAGSNLRVGSDQAISPPIFTPTFMSLAHSPIDGQSRSTSAGATSDRPHNQLNQDELRDQPHSQDQSQGQDQGQGPHVQYEFKPQPQSPDQQRRQSATGTSNPKLAMEEMVRKSMLTHPAMVVSSHLLERIHKHDAGDKSENGERGDANKLPVFSSTGTIPFAPSSLYSEGKLFEADAGAGARRGSGLRNGSYGFGGTVELAAQDDAVHGSSNGAGREDLMQVDEKKEEGSAQQDLWEVPETP